MRCLAFLGGLIVAGLLTAAAIIDAGWYNIAATAQHTAPVYWLLNTAMYQSIKRRAEDIAVPPLEDEALALRGFAHFQAHCVQCHGAPGVAPKPFARGLTPVPSSLSYTAVKWTPAQLFWTIREGIKMTGMPAWELTLTDEDIWAVVAFLKRLPLLSPLEYQRLDAPPPRPAGPAPVELVPNPARGRRIIGLYMCGTCHRIPEVVGPSAPVGPPLAGIAKRRYLAGVLLNTPENMVLWIREPQRVNPDSAMPDMGVSARDARDIAAFLYTLE